MGLKEEIKLMQKYFDGDYLDPEDVVVVERLQMIGFMKTGISISSARRTARCIGIGRCLAFDNFPWVERMRRKLNGTAPKCRY